MINCVIIDDEPLPVDLLKGYISQCPIIQLCASFNDALTGSEYLRKKPVDLLFLDIQMPDLTGIDLFRSLTIKPVVIFTTAYSNYAVEGFNLAAADYLLKPFSFDRFLQAVEKARVVITHRQVQQKNEGPSIFIKSDYQNIRIAINDILYVEALDDYVRVVTADKSYLSLMTLKVVSEMLPDANFVRVHRSFLVALDKISSVRNRIITIGKQEIPVGTTYAGAFLQRLGHN